MKANMRRSLILTCLLATVLLALPVVVQAQFTYITTNGAITITGYTGSGGAVSIPATINGLPVTSVGDYAFYETALTSVTIPNSVTNIGDYAFANSPLTSVTIPASVISIGDGAFFGCYGLRTITVHSNNPAYTSLNGVLFDKNQTTLFQYPTGNAATSYTIPNSTSTIGSGAFAYCDNLTNVTIPNSVTSIGGAAFEDTAMTSATIPDSVTNIGDEAFAGCWNLTGVIIPDSVTSIGAGVFEDCYYGLTSVTIGTGVTSIGDFAFGDCYGLTNITVTEGNPIYSSLNGILFKEDKTTLIQYPIGNTSTSYMIPNSVTNIGEYAFEDAVLSSVTIPDGVMSVGDYAFMGCGSVTNVTIGNGVTSIGDQAFDDCYSLTSVTIPDSVTSIGDYAFANDDYSFYSSLTNVTIGNGVTRIGDGAFSGTSLTSVTIGNGVTSIGDEAFANCAPTMVFFTGNAPSIGQHVFYSFRYDGNVDRWFLESATVYYLAGTTGWGATYGDLPTVMLNASPQFGATGDGFEYLSDGVKIIIIGYSGSNSVLIIPAITGLPVTRIGNYAFFGSRLTNVTIPDSVTSIGEDAFSGTSLTSVIIPNSVTSIGDDAFADCESLTNVTVPGSVTNIGDEAFGFCGNLISVYFSGNAPGTDSSAFADDFDSATAYYLPGTLGWDNFSANTGLPIAQWFLPDPLILNKDPDFGVQSNQFDFTISWATNVPVVVEACTNLANPVWVPVGTNILVGGTSYFSDPQPANLPGRFYRLRSP